MDNTMDIAVEDLEDLDTPAEDWAWKEYLIGVGVGVAIGVVIAT